MSCCRGLGSRMRGCLMKIIPHGLTTIREVRDKSSDWNAGGIWFGTTGL